MLLSYPSANRDEEVFADPFRFDVGRTPNKHLAFGFGVHYCLGRDAGPDGDQGAADRAAAPPALDRAGRRAELMQTLFVGGLKRLPIRYEL